LKNILIISYFYPPCTLTASQRPYGWVKYFIDFGFKPTVITRNWDIQISNQEDQLKSVGDDIIHQIHADYEVFFVSYKASFRDRLFNSKLSWVKKSSKFFTFLNAIGENYSNCFIPFKNIYDFANELIPARNYSTLIISGNPFIQFRFGYLLHKKFNIPWIADYRDDWTTSEIIKPKGILQKITHQLQQKAEQKWVGSAFAITSVSPVYTNRISDYVNVPGYTILNGFDELRSPSLSIDSSVFTITYNGTLYDTQDLESVVEVFLECIDLYKDKINIKINFPGIAFDKHQSNRLKKIIKGYETFFYITTRLLKDQVIEIQSVSDLLLMLTHRNIKGIPSSKLFEYLSFQKPIICFPSDHDIVEEILQDTNMGMIANNKEQLFAYISNSIDNKLKNNYSFFECGNSNLQNYHIKAQTKKMASLLK
jgi:glycosyltransferase involved in cell wall biosynthesis